MRAFCSLYFEEWRCNGLSDVGIKWHSAVCMLRNEDAMASICSLGSMLKRGCNVDCLIGCGHSAVCISRNGDANKSHLIWEMRMRTAQFSSLYYLGFMLKRGCNVDCLIGCGHSAVCISRNGDANKAHLIWEMRTAQFSSLYSLGFIMCVR